MGPDGDVSTYFLSTNRNKESIALDLKSEDGKATLRALIARADVLVENFRTGALDAKGFGYDPMFVPDAQPGNLTSAEMTAEDKDAISHRGQAVRAIVPAVVAHLEGH